MQASAASLRKLLALTGIETLARCGLVAVFVYSGIDKLLHFNVAQAEFTAAGLSPPALFVVATILSQLGGSLLLLSRRYALWGALLLAGFTAMATLIAHRFWQASPSAYVGELNAFLEHLGLIGAFLLVAHRAALNSEPKFP